MRRERKANEEAKYEEGEKRGRREEESILLRWLLSLGPSHDEICPRAISYQVWLGG